MNFLNDLIPTVIVLGVLILIHEWGHFIACRLSGVRVEKFSIGFGPEVFHIQGKETRFVVSLLPFGGFVKPAGESVSELEGGEPRAGDYLAAPVLKRIFIVVAGVLMNYLLAFFIFFGVFIGGRPVTLAQIGGFVEGYPAATSALLKGDRILRVEGITVNSWSDLTEQLSRIRREEVELEVQRGRQTKHLRVPVKVESVTDIFGKSRLLARLGILPDLEASRIERMNPLEALREAGLNVFRLTALSYKALYYLVTGQLSLKTVSGPLGIMAMTGTAAKMGTLYLLHLTAVLSISLAVINLLPIPALDGGHLLFLLIELVQRRRVSLAFQERATQIGFALLILLMVLVFYNDLVNLQVIDRVKQAFSH